MKSKKRYHDGISIPTDYNPNNGYCYAIIRLPHSVMWRAIIRGAIYPLTRYYTYRLDSAVAHDTVAKGKAIFNSLEFACMIDHNLLEINYTLKHILAHLSNRPTIDTHIAKPEFAYDANDEIDHSVNNTIVIPDKSVFKVESLLDENNISEVLQIAFLDDSTIQLPDINPFNLESKIDDIRTDINETKTHFTNDFTDLMNWFASSFRESTWNPISILNNPFSTQTFYQMLLDTFNDTQKSYTSVTIPFWGTISIPYWTKQHSFIDRMNQNFSTTFNENFDANTDLASNSHFRSVNTWLTVTWKIFEDIMAEIRDCICAIPTAISNLELSPTVNVDNPITVNNSHPITVNNSNPITIENITPTSTTTNNTTVTTTTTVNNPDGSTTTTTTTNTTPIYEPIDPTDPNSPTAEPYATKSYTNSNNHDAMCGFIFYTMSQLADFIEETIAWLNPFTSLMTTLGINGWANYVLKFADSWGVGFWAKLGVGVLRGLAGAWLNLAGFVVDFLPSYIRELRDDMACPNGGLQGTWTVNEIKQEILNRAYQDIQSNLVLNFLSYCVYTFYDYGLFDPLVEVANVDMADYAQYCPCPLQGNFTGHWWNGTTGNGAKHWYITDDSVYIMGTHTSQNVFGTVYTSEIQNGIIDPQNPLSASGILHVTSHTGFGDTAFTISINGTFTQLYYSGQTYTKV